MEGSVSVASEALLETLISRGWLFKDPEQVKALIVINSALLDDGCTVDVIESELANMDLRDIGAKSLPDHASLRKLSHLQGPIVLQVCSSRDVSRSSVSEELGSSNSRRLLKLTLTDGHTEITAVEYSHIPSIPDQVVPGTKIRLGNRALVRCGIVCLNPNVVTVLGGVVQTLHEEWEMNKRYAGFSRTSLRPSGDNDVSGPPRFEKLQIEAPSHRFAEAKKYSDLPNSNRMKSVPVIIKGGGIDIREVGKRQNHALRGDNLPKHMDSVSQRDKAAEMPSSSESRPKEVADSVPVQNQAASQKLLQKMNHPDQHMRGRRQRGRGRGRPEDFPVYTLNEWKEGKARVDPLTTVGDKRPDSFDEELARQLQDQFDLEDRHVPEVPCETEAERLRRSMFTFERDNGNMNEMGYRGRGRRGRGRGRGRGKGRFG